MQQLTRKLHSRQGASMVMALVFFLICLVIGSVIVTAAIANGVKARERYADEQEYLAVASAVRLLQTELDGTRYTLVESAPGVLNEGGVLVPPADGDYKKDEELTAAANPAQNLLVQAYAGERTGGSYVITGEGLPVVQVTMTLTDTDAVFRVETETGRYATRLTLIRSTAAAAPATPEGADRYRRDTVTTWTAAANAVTKEVG